MFSQTVDYALRVATWLAASGGESSTSGEITEATGVPAGYLVKVLQTLRRAGLLECQRGLGGGCRLARPATEITILEVVNAIDPIRRIERCPLGREHRGETLCPLHRKMDAAIAEIEGAFSSTLLADLIVVHDDNSPLCRPSPDAGPGR